MARHSDTVTHTDPTPDPRVNGMQDPDNEQLKTQHFPHLHTKLSSSLAPPVKESS